MRKVTPSVRLIARPFVDWGAIESYLDEVGGAEWRESYHEWGGETLVEFAGRLCYRSWKPGLNANVTKVRTRPEDYFDNLLKSRHGSVLEHAWYSFVLHNVSRVFTHELVRHGEGTAFSQESLRFVRLTDIPFWMPEWAQEDTELAIRCGELLAHMEAHQTWMAGHFGLDNEGVPFAEKKAKTSFMRRFAPEGVATGIVLSANIRALRHMITMRTAEGAEEEIRLVFDKVATIMSEECPLLFRDFIQTDDRQWLPAYEKV